MPPRLELKGNGRRPRNPSSIHRTSLIYDGRKKEEGKRCHSLPTQSKAPENKEKHPSYLWIYNKPPLIIVTKISRSNYGLSTEFIKTINQTGTLSSSLAFFLNTNISTLISQWLLRILVNGDPEKHYEQMSIFATVKKDSSKDIA